jgi:diguanylate cyclase (GGDEF)-like protein
MPKLFMKSKTYWLLGGLFLALAGAGAGLELGNLLDAVPWLHAAVIILLNALLLLGCIAVIRTSVRDRLEYFASIDPLTGIMNRVSFWRVLEREIRRVERYRRPLAMIMLDIDHFKVLNEARGEQVGDRVLKSMAAEIKKKIREIDFFGRIGGEEFLILAPETEPEKALNLAEKIRETIATAAFPEAGPITISLGVAQFCAGDRADLLLKRVDEALTRAKAQGRNRVACN